MDKDILKALNEQVNKEFFSAYLYLSMSAYFESTMLKGAANWMHVQAQEEVEHAMRIYNYINDRGGRVELQSLAKPESEWESPLKAFEAALDHERYISASINDIVTIAQEKKDYMTLNFLQWFIAEQVEEEVNAQDNVDKFTLVKSNPNGVFMIDRELAQRAFVSEMGNEEQ